MWPSAQGIWSIWELTQLLSTCSRRCRMVEYPDHLILRDEHPLTSYLEVQQGRRALTHSHLMQSTGLSLNLSQAAVPGFPSSRMSSLIMIRRSCPTKILIPWSHPLTQMFWYIPMGQDAAFDIAIQQFAKKESRPQFSPQEKNGVRVRVIMWKIKEKRYKNVCILCSLRFFSNAECIW